MSNSWHITCHPIGCGQCSSEFGFAATVPMRSLNRRKESTMNLILAGVSHKTSPLKVRESFALSEQRIPGALRRLQAEPEVEEAAIICTCNRVEFIVQSYDGQDSWGRSGDSSNPLWGSITTSTHTVSMCIAIMRRSATCSEWLPGWTRWWWESPKSWARLSAPIPWPRRRRPAGACWNHIQPRLLRGQTGSDGDPRGRIACFRELYGCGIG